MRVVGVFVTYDPSPSVFANVMALLSQVSEVLVVDNGSGPASQDVLHKLAQTSNVQLISNGRNLGIAAALNLGVDYALGNNYQWIATFDQDSTPPADFINKMFAAYEATPSGETIGLLSPSFVDPQSGTLLDTSARSEITTMTSGNLVKTQIFLDCGNYRADYFIDYVDHEFCLRMRANGYRILKVPKVKLCHRLGHISAHPLLGRNFLVTNHPASRRYYNTRNRILTYKQHFVREPLWCLGDIRSLSCELAKIVLFEDEKMRKMFYISKGFLHGVAGRAGPLEHG